LVANIGKSGDLEDLDEGADGPRELLEVRLRYGLVSHSYQGRSVEELELMEADSDRVRGGGLMGQDAAEQESGEAGDFHLYPELI
jgi:hypothetical protein